MPESSIFWDQLLQLIDEGRVVPVVGQDLLKLDEKSGSKLLYPYLAERLAEYFDISSDDLPEGGELNEVACRYLAQGSQIEDVYPALKTIAATLDAMAVPEPLLQLAAIRPLQLFVTTTFDALLTRALNDVRFGGSAKTRVLAYAPTESEDLPGDLKSGGLPTVYHLLGKLSATPAYAVTQEDTVEFFHSLQSDTRRPQLLFDELNRKSLLIVGSRLSGWLARFFMRMAKRQRLSAGGKTDYIADSTLSSDANLVLFLRHFSRGTKIFRGGGAIEFVNELHTRWMERHPQAETSIEEAIPATPHRDTGAVFLSYASENRDAVIAIKDALEAVGVDVFFDKEELQAGDAWEAKLRRSVSECSLFIPIISRDTLTAHRRFFRVEWNLAIDEAQKAPFTAEGGFLLPVVIDDTRVDDPGIPPKFQSTQWRALPGGRPTKEFVERVQLLYRNHQKSLTGA
jgi:TIR domain/SIR2-like domain